MAKKKKNALPSGSIRVQVYDYTDAEGKKHYKSFTAPTKKQAQARAADWKANKNKAQVPDGQWYVKQPKTYGSYREIEYPDFVIKKISHIKGKIIKTPPYGVTKKFILSVAKLDVPRFRFHDLRHYAASIMHAIGVPDQYILQRGGWSGDNVMKTVYRNAIDIETAKQNKKINEHFETLKSL